MPHPLQEKFKRKMFEDIERHGCHVVCVGGRDNRPSFAYSVGIQKTAGAPEVLVIGLESRLARALVNDYHRRVRDGESFVAGGYYGDFLEGFDVTFEVVDKAHYRDYVLWADWVYEGYEFELLQLVWPTTEGVWPWDEGAPEDFRESQPVLTRTGLRESPTPS